jgi:hypothetical protein
MDSGWLVGKPVDADERRSRVETCCKAMGNWNKPLRTLRVSREGGGQAMIGT